MIWLLESSRLAKLVLGMSCSLGGWLGARLSISWRRSKVLAMSSTSSLSVVALADDFLGRCLLVRWLDFLSGVRDGRSSSLDSESDGPLLEEESPRSESSW